MALPEGLSSSGVPDAATVPAAEQKGSAVLASEGYLLREGLRLYHCDWLPVAPATSGGPATGALVVLMHGYAEHCRRYDELSRYLVSRGHAVCRLDARGHGRSQGQRGHIRAYSEYVGDFVAFVESVVSRHPKRPLVLFGHSNGGLIAARAVQRALVSARGLVLSSPLFALRQGRKPVPDGVARWLSWALPRLPLPNRIHARDLTHDRALQAAHAVDPWLHRVATPRWYWATTLAGRAALREADEVTLPLLVLCGELDPIVEPKSISDFYERAASLDKRLVSRSGELHEVLNELDRLALFALVADWIERVAGVGNAATASPL